jgi:hypothetical protein
MQNDSSKVRKFTKDNPDLEILHNILTIFGMELGGGPKKIL